MSTSQSPLLSHPDLKPSPRNHLSPSLANTQPRKRTATVYDTVAGCAGLNGFLTTTQRSSTDITPLRPEDVLLRRVNAPTKTDQDLYNADQQLTDAQKLPHSDLLKNVHSYTSHFYRMATSNGGVSDWKSLDETALLALGILLEEASMQCLGEDGDLVFTEAESADNSGTSNGRAEKQIIGRVVPKNVHEYENDSAYDEEEEVAAPIRKRRRFRRRNSDFE